MDAFKIKPLIGTEVKGCARIQFSQSEVPTQEDVTVSIYDQYKRKYLTSGGHWHSDEVKFGPYNVQEDGTVVIGPEIVNYIEEYASVIVNVNGTKQSCVWPDTITPKHSACPIGRVVSIGGNVIPQDDPNPEPEEKVVIPQDDPNPEPEEKVVIPQDDPNPEPEEKVVIPQDDPKFMSIIKIGLVGFVLLCVAAGIAYFVYMKYFQEQRGRGEDVSTTETSDSCSFEAIDKAAGADFTITLTSMQDCINYINTEDAFRLLDNAARSGDAESLLRMGHLHNDGFTDQLFESGIGLRLSAKSDQALSYYSQAITVGSTEAEQYLAELCSTLENNDSVLIKHAMSRYCSQ